MDYFRAFSFADRVLKWFAVLSIKQGVCMTLINELGVYGKGGINKVSMIYAL